MYEAIFQTADRPFRSTPDERFFFPYDSVEQSRQTLARVVRRAEGPAMVMGSSGLGKTMLAQVVAEDLSDLFDVVKLHATRLCSRRALLQSILFELQLPYRELSEGELRLSLMNRMERSPEYAPNGLLLIVDEAHTLPVKLLEELRLITNFSRSGEPRARLILVGSLALEDTFASPQLDSFNQRLAARCYLQPMNRQQTHGFIVHQLKCIGAEPHEVITRDAMDAVYAASEGIPRLANQVMDHALVLAITSGQSPISAALVEEAWSDLQQLPAPWHGAPENSQSTQIEFGALEDDDKEEEIVHKVELIHFADTRIASEPPTQPTYQFEDLGIRPRSQFLSFGEYEVPGLLESASQRDVYSFFDAFEDIGQAKQHPPELESASTARPHCETHEFIFTQVEGWKPVELARPPGASSCESPSDENEFGMLVIQEDQPGAFNQFGGASPTAISPWEFSIADWNPTATTSSSGGTIQLGQSIADRMTPSHPMRSSDPFGEDFDEEFEIQSPLHGTWAGQQKIAASMGQPEPASNAASIFSPNDVSELEALEQIAQMQQSLDSIQYEPGYQQEVERQAMDYCVPVVSDQEHVWQVDTANPQTPFEEVVHEEIEDLISQLNFSAFSMEPDSVEQISIDYMRLAAPAPIQIFERAQAENDPPIYSMHEPAPEGAACYYDDDREMLIVEEDIPLSMRLSSIPTAPVLTAAQSYSQLFTKLRT